MKNERPTPPSCHCQEPMNLIRTITHVDEVPALFVFYCASCKHEEMKVQEREAYNIIPLRPRLNPEANVRTALRHKNRFGNLVAHSRAIPALDKFVSGVV